MSKAKPKIPRTREKRKKVQIWLTRDGDKYAHYYLWVCCKPHYYTYYGHRNKWGHDAECPFAMVIGWFTTYAAEKLLGGPMKGGPRSIRRLV